MFLNVLPILLLLTNHFSGSLPAPPIGPSVPVAALPAPPATRFDPARAPFGVTFGDLEIPYREFLAPLLPNQNVDLAVAGADSVQVRCGAGTVAAGERDHWRWRAPSTPGIYPVRLISGSDSVVVHAAVMVPFRELRRGFVRGYRVGRYPRSRRGDPAYARPAGFIEVTEANESIRVSPHFRLGQFACKSRPAYPKYLVLQPRLLEKLEGLLGDANRDGVHAQTFHVMSAYRTPWYNRAIGNSTRFSRHQYGDAADIFIDQDPEDGLMDDLDRDRRLTRRDAKTLGRLAEESDRVAGRASLAGGLSAYAGNDAHGPFVHVDARGVAARW